MLSLWDLKNPKVKLASELREFLIEQLPNQPSDIARLKLFQIDEKLRREFLVRAILKGLI